MSEERHLLENTIIALRQRQREVERGAFETGYLKGALAMFEGDIDPERISKEELLAAAQGASAEYLARLAP